MQVNKFETQTELTCGSWNTIQENNRPYVYLRMGKPYSACSARLWIPIRKECVEVGYPHEMVPWPYPHPVVRVRPFADRAIQNLQVNHEPDPIVQSLAAAISSRFETPFNTHIIAFKAVRRASHCKMPRNLVPVLVRQIPIILILQIPIWSC